MLLTIHKIFLPREVQLVKTFPSIIIRYNYMVCNIHICKNCSGFYLFKKMVTLFVELNFLKLSNKMWQMDNFGWIIFHQNFIMILYSNYKTNFFAYYLIVCILVYDLYPLKYNYRKLFWIYTIPWHNLSSPDTAIPVLEILNSKYSIAQDGNIPLHDTKSYIV